MAGTSDVVEVLKVGTVFPSYQDFSNVFEKYCGTKYVFSVRSSKSIEWANSRIKSKNKHYPIVWKYQNICLGCKHFGTYQTKSTGKYRNSTPTFRNGCKSFVKLQANKLAGGLVITDLELEHSNHLSKGHDYPEHRRLHGTQAEEMEQLLKLQIPSPRIKEYFNENHGLVLKYQDINNFKRKWRKKLSLSAPTDDVKLWKMLNFHVGQELQMDCTDDDVLIEETLQPADHCYTRTTRTIDCLAKKSEDSHPVTMANADSNNSASDNVKPGSSTVQGRLLEHILTPTSLRHLAREWLREDTPSFDYAGFVVGEKPERALLLMKEAGVFAGRPFVDAIFQELGCEVEWLIREGEYVQPVKVVAKISGKVRHLLLGERLALNCVTRASGIATAAKEMSDLAASQGWKGQVAGTRKTTPGFRLVEKYALLAGGASTHRQDLSAMIMLKDNHIWTAGSITQAVKDARVVGGFSTKIEVECRSLEEATEAATAGSEIVMLDNFSPESAAKTAKELKSLFPSLIIEVSGGITKETLLSYCAPCVDVISCSKLVQGYSTIDLSFKIEKDGKDPTNPLVQL